MQASPPLGDAWEREVVSRLPTDLQEQARVLGAFQRQRGLGCPSDLWRALLAYGLGVLSFLRLGVWLGRGRTDQGECVQDCIYERQRYRVRRIALRLPKEQAELARKRLRASGSKHGHRVSRQALARAEWVLLIPTLEQASWSPGAVLRL